MRDPAQRPAPDGALQRLAATVPGFGLSAGEPVGYAAAGLFGPESGRYGVVVDLWIEPDARRRGYGRAALAELLAWLRSVGADRALVTFDPADPAQSALFRDGEVNSQRMVLRLDSPADAPSPDGLSWRPMTDSEYPEWLASEISGFAQHEQSFVYSVLVKEGSRCKGYGRAIMRLGERLSADAGDRVLGLNVFGHNTVAIRMYTSLGYEVTEQSRTILL